MAATDKREAVQFDLTSKLYNPELSKEENFEQGRNYVLLKVSKDSFAVEDPAKIFNSGTKYLTKPDDLYSGELDLDVLWIDTHENSAHAVYLKNFRKYQSNFFDCEERVFFEALLVKHKAFGGEFSWSIPQCQKELGIKRSRRESIVKRFMALGIIAKGQTSIPGEQMKTITQFKVNVEKVLELIPQIYNKEFADLADIELYIMQNYLDVEKEDFESKN